MYVFAGNNGVFWVDAYGLHWTDWIPDWIDPAANFCAGAGDDLTFGLTDMARESLGWNDQVDRDSPAYKGGEYTSAGVGFIVPGGAVKTAARQASKRALKEAAENTAKKRLDDLIEAAKKQYPKKANKPEEWHHITPKYLGGDPGGPCSKIPAAYHQKITNKFRDLWGYGKGRKPTEEQLEEIMRKVYEEFPLPRTPS